MPETISIEGEPTSPEAAYRASGIAYAVAYGLFLVMTLWHARGYKKTMKLSWRRLIRFSVKEDFVHDKMFAVHILLAMFALFDIAYGLAYAVLERYDYRAQAVHIFALMFFYTAFCLIPLILNESLEFGGAYYYIRLFCRVAVIGIVLDTAISTGLDLYYKENYVGIIWYYIVFLCLTTGVLLTLALWMLFYAVRLFLFFSTSGSMNMPGYLRSERFRAIIKMLSIMIVFSLCATIRAVCTVLLILRDVGVYDGTIHFSVMGWFLVSQWIPFLTSGCLMILVCTANKRARAPSRGQSGNGGSLQPPNQSAARDTRLEESHDNENDDSPFTGKRTVVLSGGDEESRGSETANPVIEMSEFGRDSNMASSYEVPGPMNYY